MSLPHFHYNPQQEPPMSIVIEHLDKTRDGHWRPCAFVKLGASLRTSGFIQALPPEELKNFLLLLTFLSANGHCAPGVPQIASALRLSEAKTRGRMERLTAARWHGQPFVLPHRVSNGLDAFVLCPGLLPMVEETNQTQAPLIAAPREAIIEHSRRRYARSRAEVERDIERQLGRGPIEAAAEAVEPTSESAQPLDEAQRQLRGELIGVGLMPEQANDLLARFDPVRIRRQLMWLPYRPARNRAGLLLAAIKDDYEAPPALGRASQPPQFAPHDESAV